MRGAEGRAVERGRRGVDGCCFDFSAAASTGIYRLSLRVALLFLRGPVNLGFMVLGLFLVVAAAGESRV